MYIIIHFIYVFIILSLLGITINIVPNVYQAYNYRLRNSFLFALVFGSVVISSLLILTFKCSQSFIERVITFSIVC